ncbi:MAG: DEAD/DEAH box helicase, partial [Bacteroidota bacterium]
LKSIDFSVILQALPIWLVNITDIYDILPLKKELFDIAVIDEASQSDIASALPILYRAKRVVVVGDAKQLRHISFLSRAKQTKLQEDLQLSHYDTFKLNYREQSILDIVHYSLQKQSQIHLLNEHFRSLPDIIQFSNQYFYNNALHIMTQNLHNQAKKGLVLVQQSGERDKKGHNPSEAQFIIDRIKAIIQQETSLTQQVCHSIGVLSPFRDQVDYLSKTIKAQFSLEQITKHQIEVGTAYSFQGNERDIMFISWVVDKQSASGSFSYLNKEDVFNVSITRARVKQYVITSIERSLLNHESILAAYLGYLVTSQQENPTVQVASTSTPPRFGEEVATVLRTEGFHCEIGYFIAGLEVDLVIQKGDQYLGIDLVGYPDDHLAVFTIERYQILQRAGLSVLPIPYTRWYFDQAACVTAIKKAFEEAS